MKHSRREILKLGLGSVPLAYVLGHHTSLFAATSAKRPNSKFNGVQIGAIAPYSFRGMPSSAEDILGYLVELGISAVEMQNDPAEQFAGAPGGGMRGGPPGSLPNATQSQQLAVAGLNGALADNLQAVADARSALAEAAFSDTSAIQSSLAALSEAERELAMARAKALAKLQASPERLTSQQIEALIAQAAPQPSRRGRPGPDPAMTAWRANVSMKKFEALRKLYNDAGVTIYGFKLSLNLDSPESEYDYAFNAVEALGANQLTMELPGDPATSKRIGEYAAKRKIWVGYHAHTQGSLTAWDTAFSQSEYNGANIDIGHYVAGTSKSPVPFVEKYHDRITSMHLKDRKIDNGPNMPWGEGDTPIVEVLRLMKRERYTFPATIELEYPVPDGSTVMAELAKCVQYCQQALA